VFRASIAGAILFSWSLFFFVPAIAAGQQIELALDPQHTTIAFNLGDVLHTVHGTFQLKHGDLHFDPAAGKLSGEIIVDAKSGQSGNGMRDRKMHREVLESDRYSEIAFRPDHIDGSVASSGKSSVHVHGVFTIHGADHELSVPAEIEMSPEHWSASLYFAVPYASWGMKNPSTLFLRVNDSVDIDMSSSGSITRR
jgi:polyisoprenoid-binding protein YceI